MRKNNVFLIYILSFFSGFLSLGLEVIWIRIVSFSAHSVPQAFSYTLGFFLIGLAYGAWFGRRICKKRSITALDVGRWFFIAAFTDIFVLLIAYIFMGTPLFIPFSPFLILISTTVRGIIFPLVHHIGTAQSKTGRQISNVYFSNVFGSALSPLLISFIALDFFSTQQVYVLICLLSALLYALCLLWDARPRATAFPVLVSLVLAGAVVAMPEKIFHRMALDGNAPNSLLFENKHGFVQIVDENGSKTVYGANVYDGKFNTNLLNDINGIFRAYIPAALKNDLRNILVIGLSTGSWAQVLRSIPEMEHMTIVEINPIYKKLIAKEPMVAPLLQDERVEIVMGDGRKWLHQHPDEQFDLILMNTTFYWRAYDSNLLSQEFLRMIKNHLTPNGMALYNTTGSIHAVATAQHVFPYAYQTGNQRYVNTVIAGLNEIHKPSPEIMRRNVQRLRWDNTNVFTEAQLDDALHAMDIFIVRIPERPYIEIITDDNMISEFKYGIGLDL